MKQNPYTVLALVVACLVTPAATGDRLDQFGDPLRGLNPKQAAGFAEGLDQFSEVETVDEGLGPVFNGRSCGECHNVPAIGGGSERVVTRFARYDENGVFDPLTQFGGTLIQDHAIGPDDVPGLHAFKAETVPPDANVILHRRTTPLFGLGLVDAVPDSTFVALAATEAANDPATAGRVNIVDDLVHGGTAVGKFGWKAQVPNLAQFSADAYLNEMGVTSSLFPNENCPSGDCSELAFNPRPDLNDTGNDVGKFLDFMTMLAPAPATPRTPDEAGERIFNDLGCGSCHVATLHTGKSEIAQLNDKLFHPYSDFLLHDMGSLGDGLPQGTASPTEMRTAPLWGLRAVTKYLHDGRASTIEDAILAHDGQGKPARDRFKSLDAATTARLLEFLKSL